MSSSTVFGFAFNSEELTSSAITQNTLAEYNGPSPLVQSPNFYINMLQNKYAEKLDASVQDMENTDLYAFIDQWYGTKYAWGGTTQNGVDCSALVQNMYREVFKTDIVRTSYFQHDMSTEVSKDSLQEGDLVFFKTMGNRISHVGVYLKNNFFVHSCSSKGVTISSLDENYWSKVYAGAGRIEKGDSTAQNDQYLAMN
ncbi:C40 family peptidase [Polluticoccus soli]|uniref:C40 family peptidase n=1 Tax=Polluticoccus soli TaxID=3034150 RepID=UPI0023E1FC37|nr:NlpC/P60 family protein [Flavipsychrobacter sp. JY13-12]